MSARRLRSPRRPPTIVARAQPEGKRRQIKSHQAEDPAGGALAAHASREEKSRGRPSSVQHGLAYTAFPSIRFATALTAQHATTAASTSIEEGKNDKKAPLFPKANDRFIARPLATHRRPADELVAKLVTEVDRRCTHPNHRASSYTPSLGAHPRKLSAITFLRNAGPHTRSFDDSHNLIMVLGQAAATAERKQRSIHPRALYIHRRLTSMHGAGHQTRAGHGLACQARCRGIEVPAGPEAKYGKRSPSGRKLEEGLTGGSNPGRPVLASGLRRRKRITPRRRRKTVDAQGCRLACCFITRAQERNFV
ncbi:hypothetical protein HPB48_017898 [Haemaphysalis longicornis]|uniref:Uncharacterized protein n=1 Tax=Haemaphysalis longicornis TaxID=44386 RepID=A0A9J6GSG7_HAELO|nr:hypothetical protein HPB48_017898 [Haemaphysalis longicornis]